jgi:hypothetical protein
VAARPQNPPPQNPPPPQNIPLPAAPSTTLSIKTVPADAQLLIDDAKVSNPFSGKFPKGDVRHRLVVKAAGFRTESDWITFDADRELVVKLEKGSGTHERTKPPVTAAQPHDNDGKPIYKGTKGKLITEFPE